jgi:hypothetical protein
VGSLTYNLIRDAILKRRIVTGWYAGHYREICPHAIGLAGGREKFFAYQFGGTSFKGLHASGSDDNWRCFIVADFTVDEVRLGQWHTTRNGARDQRCVEVVDVEIA